METEMEEWKDSSRTARERETFAAKGPTRGRELYPGSHWFVSVTAKLDWGRNRQARRGANWLAQRPGLWILLIGRPAGTVRILLWHASSISKATSQCPFDDSPSTTPYSIPYPYHPSSSHRPSNDGMSS